MCLRECINLICEQGKIVCAVCQGFINIRSIWTELQRQEGPCLFRRLLLYYKVHLFPNQAPIVSPSHMGCSWTKRDCADPHFTVKVDTIQKSLFFFSNSSMILFFLCVSYQQCSWVLYVIVCIPGLQFLKENILSLSHPQFFLKT